MLINEKKNAYVTKSKSQVEENDCIASRYFGRKKDEYIFPTGFCFCVTAYYVHVTK